MNQEQKNNQAAYSVFAVAVLALLAVWNLINPETRALELPLNDGGIVNAGDNKLYTANVKENGNPLFDEVTAKVLPDDGFQSRIFFGESVLKLVQNGVIDKNKFEEIYKERAASGEASLASSERGGLPLEIKELLVRPSQKPILLTKENANFYINLLWALGLSNYMSVNTESPVNGENLSNFASTGGWTLGKAENGGEYFNKFKIVLLTPEEEALVRRIAENTYRPCCDNSTFFQDCNHGSALLGLLQLGAAQGLSEAELYREALAFNSFWFPDSYVQTALLFKVAKGVEWENVDPQVVMSKDYSSASGWYENVNKEVNRLGLIPEVEGGGSCGV